MKQIKYFLQQYDWLWSVPSTFFMFWLFGQIVSYLFGYTVALYDMSFMQPLFLASGIVVGASGFATLGMRFNFKGIFHFIWGEKKDGVVTNKSKEKWQELSAFQQIILSFSLYFLYLFAVLIVYIVLV